MCSVLKLIVLSTCINIFVLLKHVFNPFITHISIARMRLYKRGAYTHNERVNTEQFAWKDGVFKSCPTSSWYFDLEIK